MLGAVVLVLVAVAAWAGLRALLGGSSVDQSRPGPVVAVPGYGGRVASLDPLVERLRGEGREVVVFAPSQGGTGDLRVQARRLATLVRETLARTGEPSVDLVGYSAGGVIARLYVRDDGGADVVRRVVTLGSPHHGTDVAQLAVDAAGSCPTACEQLVPDSDLLRSLDAGDETPQGPQWATVRSDDDEVVTPTGSAALQGARNVLVQDLCPDAVVGHDQLPGAEATGRVLDAALGPGPVRAPAPGC
ncbi:Triacylglycerol esterase/lipase EstA, alpha/beta hydrolase fold [Nocardioides scoriae]|uniref:Triacylglycerol esterase/lipase EstA, alpha/beta hydrolase fold n=1 Tax=Nocardioides scoriae TaxID=642780 RepID=A0A1H1LXH9_9ACTN|nr:alpha/beta fold hydrolase [Nocardioides scoriae]SDR79304.1 Triacylglycerol esterase/lipase EstA, alpha/beta hydrolase fold [Nocardioides scoriae]